MNNELFNLKLNIMRNLILISVLITFNILLLSSCKKCVQNNLGNVTFNPTDLKLIPYKGTETLTFKDSLGNTLIFTGQGRKTDNYQQQWFQCPNGDCPGAGGESCTGNYFSTEGDWTEFINRNSQYFFRQQIGLSMDRGNPFHQNIKKLFTIDFSYNDNSINWEFYAVSFYFNDTLINQPYDATISKFSYKNNLTIGSKKFNSVYILEQFTIPSSTTNDPQKYGNLQYVFYTIKDGIVGFKEKDSKTWYLSN